jgi:hypothetical protein
MIRIRFAGRRLKAFLSARFTGLPVQAIYLIGVVYISREIKSRISLTFGGIASTIGEIYAKLIRFDFHSPYDVHEAGGSHGLVQATSEMLS